MIFRQKIIHVCLCACFAPVVQSLVHWYRLQTEYGDIPPSMLAAYGACFVVKKCAEMAYAKQHRAMLASDMVSEVGAVFYYHFESQKDVSK